MKVCVLHVVRDLDVASGGPSRSVPALARAQALWDGVDVQVLFGDRGQHTVDLDDDLVAFGPLRRGDSGFSQVIEQNNAKIVHLHGLWSPLLHRVARLARKRGIPYVVSARGMLTDWALAHRPWRKRVAWRLYQRRDLESAAAMIGSSGFEAEGIAKKLPGQRVEVVPNGCDPMPAQVGEPQSLPAEPNVRWALALGRLHRVKGYSELIDSWNRVRPPGWKLAIAGPDEGGYRAQLEARIASHGLSGDVLLTGPADDDEKWALLQRCELFLAPSHTENFGMAIAEALQAGRPVLTTRGTPWRELVERDCGWWIELNPESLDSALRGATGLATERLREMGLNGQNLIRENYSWDAVAAQSLDLYRSVLGATSA